MTTQAQKQKPVAFSGTIAKIWFRRTKPNQVPVLTLVLAEHPDPTDAQKTNFRRVVATRELAEALVALDPPLFVGEGMEVKIGYPFRRVYKIAGKEKVNECITLWIARLRGKDFVAKRQKKEAARSPG